MERLLYANDKQLRTIFEKIEEKGVKIWYFNNYALSLRHLLKSNIVKLNTYYYGRNEVHHARIWMYWFP